MSYGVSCPGLYRRAPGMTDKFSRGDLPVEQPTKFELLINGKSAKAISLKVPPIVLVRIDEVID